MNHGGGHPPTAGAAGPRPDRPLSDWSDHLERALRDAGTPRRVLVYRRTASTQDIARARIPEPVVVLADEQLAGRGRLGRRWVAPAGSSVLMSVTHPLDESRGESADRVTLVTAVALAETLEPLLGGARLEIKWPNDIMAGGRKLAGILVEAVSPTPRRRVALIGVGINVHQLADDDAAFPIERPGGITSMAMLGGRRDRLDVAARVIRGIDAGLANRDDARLLDAWRARNLMSEQRVTLASAGNIITGTVVDLDPAQGLIVRRDSGEIVHLPAATTTVL